MPEERPLLHIVAIQRLHGIADRRDLLPEELRELDLVLIFETLHDAEATAADPDSPGVSWGKFFDYSERRQTRVKMSLHGYIDTRELYIKSSKGRMTPFAQYIITDKGRDLLERLRAEADIR